MPVRSWRTLHLCVEEGEFAWHCARIFRSRVRLEHVHECVKESQAAHLNCALGYRARRIREPGELLPGFAIGRQHDGARCSGKLPQYAIAKFSAHDAAVSALQLRPVTPSDSHKQFRSILTGNACLSVSPDGGQYGTYRGARADAPGPLASTASTASTAKTLQTPSAPHHLRPSS